MAGHCHFDPAAHQATRSFDERTHSFLGFVLHVTGGDDGQSADFSVAVSEGAQAKWSIRVGDSVSGRGIEVVDKSRETAGFYKVSGLGVAARAADPQTAPPPWLGIPPPLTEYRKRGHRRLDEATFATDCAACIWGARMPVQIIVDHWDPTRVKSRFETFCYGPKACPLYRPGPRRRVPGRRGQVWVEEDWVDEDLTAHRGPME